MTEREKNLDDIKSIVEDETRSAFRQKSAINKYMIKDPSVGVQANAKSLGITPEKVLYSYTFDELNEPSTYHEITKNLLNKEVRKVIIHSDITVEGISKITKEATKQEIPFTIVDSPEFKGEIGLELIR